MSNRILKYLSLLALVLFIIAISSFWFTGPSFREKDVALELEGPTQISAGEEVSYILKYSNDTRSTLHGLEFHFVYPEGSAVMADGKLIEDHTEDFSIDELKAGEEGEKEFRAFILGERGSIKVAKATMSFKSGSLSSVFEKNATLSTTIIDAPISLTLVAPPSMVSGGGVQYILDYRNSSGQDASDMIIEFDYPDGFSPKDFEPAPTSGYKTWHIDLLKKGAGERITINGTLTGREDENKIVTAILKRKLSGDYVDYQKVSAVTVISNPVFGLGITVNNSTDYSASLGDRLSYTVTYANNSNINMSGMNLAVKFEGDMYDLSKLDTRGGYYDSSSKTIIWDSSTVNEFGNFVPGTQGKITFSVSLKSSFPSSGGTSQDRFVKATAKFSTPNVPTGFSGSELSVSANIVTRITTQPSFNQSAYYKDPDSDSSGPFPLRAGEVTYFTIHWQLTNPGNDIDNVSISAKLPSGVEWDGSASANNGLPAPKYNPNTAQVEWNFTKLPYGAGILSEKYEGIFRIKVKPSSTQKGNSMPLLDSAHFIGKDNYTNQDVVINKPVLTSDNLVDRPREGTVQ